MGVIALASVAALPVLSFFLFGTFQLYAGNADEFEAGFRTLLPRYVPAMVIIWLLLTGAGLLLRGSIRQRYVCAVFGLGVLIWFQGTFLVGSYGVLDGRGLDWQAFSFPAWLDIALWIGVLAGFVIAYRQVGRLAVSASAVLIALQLVSGLHVGLTSDTRLWSARIADVSGPPEDIFQYSREHNVVQLILDNFQTDIFEELIEEEGLAEDFDGFVLFRENAAVTPYTILAIPSILSGQVYDGGEPPGEFFRRSIRQGLPSRLHEQGYRVNLSTMRSLEDSDHDAHYRIPSVYGATAREMIESEAARLVDITLFRHVPHLVRNWVYNDNNWRLSPVMVDPETLPKSFAHKQFFRDYTERLDPRLDGPAFHFLHLWPPHPPYVTTEDGEYAGEALPNTRENYKHEARAILLQVVEFLEKLKDRGIYDDTLIVLHSDHGGAFEPEFTPTRTLALKAIKPRNSRGPLRTSNAQVALTDVAATIVEEEELDIDWQGRSAFDVSEDEVRERRFVFYHGNRNQYLRPVSIKGSLYSADSYTHLESVPIDMTAETYQPGNTVGVGIDGEGSVYLGEGWSTPDAGVVWNNGQEATLNIPIEPQENDLQLSLWLIPAIYEDVLEQQRISLYSADRKLGQWTLESREGTRLQASVPAELMQTGELELRLELPDAASQQELGVGGDQRQQSIALSRFLLE